MHGGGPVGAPLQSGDGIVGASTMYYGGAPFEAPQYHTQGGGPVGAPLMQMGDSVGAPFMQGGGGPHGAPQQYQGGAHSIVATTQYYGNRHASARPRPMPHPLYDPTYGMGAADGPTDAFTARGYGKPKALNSEFPFVKRGAFSLTATQHGHSPNGSNLNVKIVKSDKLSTSSDTVDRLRVFFKAVHAWAQTSDQLQLYQQLVLVSAKYTTAAKQVLVLEFEQETHAAFLLANVLDIQAALHASGSPVYIHPDVGKPHKPQKGKRGGRRGGRRR